MNSSRIIICEFPSNLGLKNPEGKTEPGVKKLPRWLKSHGFHSQIDPEKTLNIEPPKYTMDLDAESGVRNADKIVEYAIKQRGLISKELDENNFLLIIGGDCSIIIGSAIALKQKGRYGLFFIDGHTDFIGPELSQTGGAAGMDLAIVAGHGHEKLTNILDQKPYFDENNIFCVGNREYDDEYVQPILDSSIGYFDLKGLRDNGIKNTVREFLDRVDGQGLDGFFVHLDVDVLNDNLMPAVDSRKKDGLSYNEFSELLKPLLASKKAIGIEITILDPDLDEDGKYTIDFVRNFIGILEHAKSNTQTV